MINAIVTKQHCNLAPGKPKVFLRDENFKELFNNPDLAKSIWEFFGSNVCIGRLGHEEAGIFVEDSYPIPKFQENCKEVLGYYERISSDI